MSNKRKRGNRRRSGKSDLPLGDQLNQSKIRMAEFSIEQQLLLEKAFRSGNPSDIVRANAFVNSNKPKGKSYLFDPYAFASQLGYKDKPIKVTYGVLRNMARAPIIKSVITTRVEQVSSFHGVQDDPDRIGWTVRKKKAGLFLPQDDKKQDVIKPQEAYEIEGIINFIENGGVEKNKWLAESFDGFLRKIVPDALTFDQTTFEIVQTRSRKPYRYFATDGALHRLADSYNNDQPRKDQTAIDGYYPAYVQLYQGIVQAEYYPWELCFGIRNRSTNVYNNGYGVAELEDMVRIVTWMLYGDSYNGKFFSQGSAPKGMFKVTGTINDDKMAEFRQAWRAQTAGVENAWKIPVLQGAENIDWIDMHNSNKDMEFSKWQSYLILLSCALYKIDPEEVGFGSFIGTAGGSGGGGTTYDGNKEYRINYSKDKGLFPLLKFISRQMNKYLVSPLSNDKYEFVFTGIEENLEDSTLENDIKKLENGIYSWQDVRKKYDLPTTLDKDDFLLNPIWMQFQQMKMQGSPESNSAIDQMMGTENAFMDNMFDQTMEKNKDNPFMQDVRQLIKENNKTQDIGGNPFMDVLKGYLDGELINKR